jgi:hypothetical protein
MKQPQKNTKTGKSECRIKALSCLKRKNKKKTRYEIKNETKKNVYRHLKNENKKKVTKSQILSSPERSKPSLVESQSQRST